jgi:hypothetical protein
MVKQRQKPTRGTGRRLVDRKDLMRPTAENPDESSYAPAGRAEVLTRALAKDDFETVGPEKIVFRTPGFYERVSYAQKLKPGMTLDEIERCVVLDELERQGGDRGKTGSGSDQGIEP